MRTGVIQFKSTGSKDGNLEKSIALLRNAAKQGAQVICLQELFLTDYFCFEENPDFFSLADNLNSSEFLRELTNLSSELDLVLILSCFEKRTKGLYFNTNVVVDQGEVLGLYRKSHIPDDPGYYEKYYFTPGDTGYRVFDTSKGKIGTLVCWDQWFPEAARATALKGAEIIFYPTAIGWDMSDDEDVRIEELNAWVIMHQSHAIANGIPIVCVNRVGEENGLKFWGSSMVINAFGSILHRSSVDNEEVEVIDVNLDETSFYRHRWPFLRDRRVDNYKSLLLKFDDE